MEPDFSGYVTRNDLKCSDGRTIRAGAFAHCDGTKVPLVWQHQHGEAFNVLGHALLENRHDGVYGYGFFNDTEAANHAKTLVKHGDIVALSIFANNLKQRGGDVLHGNIREVSLVLSGANPGAFIENVYIKHGDTSEVSADEAIIYTNMPLEHAELPARKDQEAMATDTKEKTVQDVFDSLTEEQKNVVYYIIGEALSQNNDDEEAAQSNMTDGDSLKHTLELLDQEGYTIMPRNVFEQNGVADAESPTLTHAQLETIVKDAQRIGSFKESFLAHAEEYGITNIDFLFPDARTLSNKPELIARRTEWVKDVIDSAKHSPFSRIKTVGADITAEEARAKGYVKGNKKKDEIIRLIKRVTTPTTVYKKQKLDRDDIVDITDLDVVAWLKWEMRFMLEEELARAVLIGDGREPDDEDKIDEEKLRPIAWDDDMYSHQVSIPANTTADGLVESIIRARKFYKGTGTPALYTTDDILTDMILLKDKVGRRLYNTEAELAAALRVSKIVVVEPMETIPDLLAIIVNMADYTIGADKGGEISMFDDFDIDYNQQKYLIETRVSGALTKFKSAVVVKRTSGTTVTPLAPNFDPDTNTITIPTVTGVSYFNVTNPMSEVELTDGAAVIITETTDIEARPDAGYNFPHNTDADWTFAYTAP